MNKNTFSEKHSASLYNRDLKLIPSIKEYLIYNIHCTGHGFIQLIAIKSESKNEEVHFQSIDL